MGIGLGIGLDTVLGIALGIGLRIGLGLYLVLRNNSHHPKESASLASEKYFV